MSATDAPDTDPTWTEIWNANQNLFIGLIAGVAVFQIIVFVGCCACAWFCRRMGYNNGLQESQQQYDPTYQQPQPPQQQPQQPPMQLQPQQQQVMYQQPQTAVPPQQPMYVTSRQPGTVREDPYARPASTYYSSEPRGRSVVRTYSSKPDYYR